MSTTFYTNEFWVESVTIAELTGYSQDIQFRDLDGTLTNTLTTLKRYDTSNPADTGTDISSKGSIATNVLTLSGLFTNVETPAAGTYRIDMVVTGQGGSPVRERNMLVTVNA